MYVRTHILSASTLFYLSPMTSKLQEEIDARNEQVRLYVAANGGRSCPMCEQPFGIIFSTGARCPECFRKVCKQCRVPPQATRNFICTLCEKKRFVHCP